MPTQFDREDALQRLGREEFDVLVVGGGVTGCGVALDAAARGLKVALVEARDLASGTSSKSSKLIHGGLRYLQQHDYILVYEALHERQRLIRNAPHLVHPLPFLIPLFGRDGVVSKSVAQAYSTALWLYDVTGGVRIGHRHKRIQPTDALAHFPVLRTERLVASFLYWDAQADDARLTLALARTAAHHGAVVANYCPVRSLVVRDGRVRGATLDNGTEVKARTVVNAGGVWSEQVSRLVPGEDAVTIRPAKGIHVTVRADRLPCDYASVLSVPGDKRSIFVVPWAADETSDSGGAGRFTYIGTTDTDYDGPLDDPECTSDDVDYVLGAVNAWTTAQLTPADVTATWAGLRPLISDAHLSRTADLSRRHRVTVSERVVVSVTGGKLTTYRKMAADTVDAVLSGSAAPGGRTGPLARAVRTSASRVRSWAGRSSVPSSSTARLTLWGGEDGGRPDGATAQRAASLGVTGHRYVHLSGRHGSNTAEVIAVAASQPDGAQPLHPRLPYIQAEVIYAARDEMALTVTDVLARRTRALILDRGAALESAPLVADLMASELGWSEEDRRRQLAEFESLVAAEASSYGEAP